jgi:hypothetical protein
MRDVPKQCLNEVFVISIVPNLLGNMNHLRWKGNRHQQSRTLLIVPSSISFPEFLMITKLALGFRVTHGNLIVGKIISTVTNDLIGVTY